MLNLVNIISCVEDGKFNSSTELLKKLGLKLTFDNYKQLKKIMISSGCEYIGNKKDSPYKVSGYIIDEMKLRMALAQKIIKESRK